MATTVLREERLPPVEVVLLRPSHLVRRGLPQVAEASIVPAALLYFVHDITFRTITRLLTGLVLVYFLQPVLGALLLSISFAASVACGRPLLIRVVSDFCPVPPDVLRSAPVRSILSRLTLAWAVVHLLNGLLTAVLLFTAPLRVFLLVRLPVMYLVTALAGTVSVLCVRRTARADGFELRFDPCPVTVLGARTTWLPASLRQVTCPGEFGPLPANGLETSILVRK